jgi:glycosyltransferase involved in cell wall biosynthesis
MPFSQSVYQAWLSRHTVLQADSDRNMQNRLADLAVCPLVSIVMPVFNPPLDFLRQAIESVIAQSYSSWELCIADDASTDPGVKKVIEGFAARDTRIKVAWRDVNGHVSAASNSALDLAQGELIVLLDHDDRLARHALLYVVHAFALHPDTGIVYSDEDKLDSAGKHVGPFFKPDWSPHLLFGQCYVGHLFGFRKADALRIGGFRTGLEGAQGYDLILRLTATAKAVHLPRVLYHWRLRENSTPLRVNAKPYAHNAGKRALGDALVARYGNRFSHVEDGELPFTYVPRFRVPGELKISIIVPTRDKIEYLSACVSSICNESTFQNFEIVIVDNNSSESATVQYLDSISTQDARIVIKPAPFLFNWSKLNNLGAATASGDLLVFLNNDTRVISRDWLERLSEWALLPEVATVGALLFYEDGTIQHSGVVVGMGGWADHVFKGMRQLHQPSPFVSPLVTRDVLAVTGACVAIERQKLAVLGGFDETFQICGSDVELGIRAHRQGFNNVLCTAARLYHYESKSRDGHIPQQDFQQSRVKYAPFRTDICDPYFNPNLDLMSTTPALTPIPHVIP